MALNESVNTDTSTSMTTDSSTHHSLWDRIKESAKKVETTISNDWHSGHKTKAVLHSIAFTEEVGAGVTKGYAGDAVHEVAHVAKSALPIINEEVLIFGGLALAAGWIVLSGMKQVNATIDKLV